MIEEEKEHYLYVIDKYVFPLIISQKYSWSDKELWEIFSRNYNKEIELRCVEIITRHVNDLIGMGKVLQWCNCADKNRCYCIVPIFPYFGAPEKYVPGVQPTSGTSVTWENRYEVELNSIKEPSELKKSVADELLLMVPGEEFSNLDISRASHIYNDLIMNKQFTTVLMFLQASKKDKPRILVNQLLISANDNGVQDMDEVPNTPD